MSFTNSELKMVRIGVRGAIMVSMGKSLWLPHRYTLVTFFIVFLILGELALTTASETGFQLYSGPTHIYSILIQSLLASFICTRVLKFSEADQQSKFHLSTLLLMMLYGSLMLWANVSEHRLINSPGKHLYDYRGFPHRAIFNYPDGRHAIYYDALFENIGIALAGLFLVCWFWEWWLARNKKAPDVTTPGAPNSSL